MKNQLGDAPIQEEYREKMQFLAQALDEIFNGEPTGAAREIGFVLLVFPIGAIEGRCNYISNGADRADIICLFKEMIARFQGQPEMKGNA